MGPALRMYLIRNLFVSLQRDALVFLAGIWLNAKSGDALLIALALQHANVFLQAHISANVGVDFQTIVPALLVALQNSEPNVRRAAVQCFVSLTKADQRFTEVYAFDAIYGASQGKYMVLDSSFSRIKLVADQLQYLSQEDLKLYLQAIVEHQQHFLFDGGYSKVFHQEHLGKAAKDSKKDAR